MPANDKETKETLAAGVTRRPALWSVRSLAGMGLLVALSVVIAIAFPFSVALGGVEVQKLSLNVIPVQLAGLLFGPLAGLMGGFLADLVKALLRPTGPYNPLFGISMGMMGFLPALLLGLLSGQRPKLAWEPAAPCFDRVSFLRLLPCVGVAQAVCSVGFSSAVIAWVSNVPVWSLLPTRAVNLLLYTPIACMALDECARGLRRLYVRGPKGMNSTPVPAVTPAAAVPPSVPGSF